MGEVLDLAALLQLADVAFPAGGFGHSFGLETAIVEERVTAAPALEAWIVQYLLAGCAPLDGAALVLAFEEPGRMAALDARVTAAQPNAEIRRANAHLARATLDIYAAIGLAAEATSSYAGAIARGDAAGVHALAAGIGYRAVGAPIRTALEAHATVIVASLASVAARAVPLGQRAVALVRWRLRDAIGAFVERALTVRSIDDLSSSALRCEIDGLRHRVLPARLFAS
jgi:urease accessory protein